MKSLLWKSPVRRLAAGLAVPLLLAVAPNVHAGTIGINATLANGWTNAPFATSNVSVTSDGTVISFSGAMMTTGTNQTAFTLPSSYRPATDVYVPADLCGAANGQVHITPAGVVSIQAEDGNVAAAFCFTSLDGVSYARQPIAGFANLTLTNGWQNATPDGASSAAARLTDKGLVQLKGAIFHGSSAIAFTLPAQMRPASDVYVNVLLGNDTEGRLLVHADGTVSIEEKDGTLNNAEYYTSLDGASFFVATGGTAMTLKNGWTGAPFATRPVTAQIIDGQVRFEGAMAGGTKATAFTLPRTMRPAAEIYIPVDLCDSHTGRLHILPTGVVSVETIANEFSLAACFTSLDGAWFTQNGYVPMSLQNGWTASPFGTHAVSAAKLDGVVTFQGGMKTTVANPVAFTLPAGFRPETDVYVAVNLANSRQGRLWIQPSGVVTVQAIDFSQAQGFVSMDGASFVPAKAGYTKVSLKNGWTGAGALTSGPAVALTGDGNVVTFKGAVRGGSSSTIGTIPAKFRPSADVYLRVSLCDSHAGRLIVAANGELIVLPDDDATVADTTCLTSLDGASYVRNDALVPLTLKGTWTDETFSIVPAAAENLGGVVRLEGQIDAGSNSNPFQLPLDQRPTADVYIPTTMCNGANGRIHIQTTGNATVQPEDGNLGTAYCFTSLDGLSFVQ